MRFFTSDHHFGHRNIIDLTGRPFASVEQMNETMVENWNKVVGSEDEVWHLGDVALGPITESLKIIGRLNGVKHLVVGNHDRCFPGQRKSAGLTPDQWVGVYTDAGFADVSPCMETQLGEQRVVASHFPYAGDSGEHKDRWGSYRRPDNGVTLLHGHTHRSNVTSRSPLGTLQVHVGVDAWDFTPVADWLIEACILVERRDRPRDCDPVSADISLAEGTAMRIREAIMKGDL